MRQYATLPIDRLVNDVTVDPIHVRELADSIKVSGPITPVLVRKENLSLIDGFHRVAAMKELGFQDIECIVLDCDEETFWDMRITAASTHKAVTFARVVDWIDEVFQLAPAMQRHKGSYKSAYSLFETVYKGEGAEDAKAWATNKAQQWGLSIATIRNWLQTRQSLAPDLLSEAKSSLSSGEETLSFSHYQRVGQTLIGQPELQRQVINKAREEGLTSEQTREVARAVKQAPTPAELRAILTRPLIRTAEDLTREAKVETLLNEPVVQPTPRVQQRQLTGLALEVYLDLQQQVHNVKRLRPEHIDALTSSQRAEFLAVINELMGALHQLADSLGSSVEGGVVIEGKMLEDNNYGASNQRVQTT